MKLKGCKANLDFGKGGNFSPTKVNFGHGLEMEFHANGSLAPGSPSGEVKILETAPVQVKVSGQKCNLFIPAQTLPVGAEHNPEKEFETAEYGTEKEATEKPLEQISERLQGTARNLLGIQKP